MYKKPTQTQRDFLLLLMGVLLGVFGNIVANQMDREFLKYGFMYDLVSVLVFFVLIYSIFKLFIKN